MLHNRDARGMGQSLEEVGLELPECIMHTYIRNIEYTIVTDPGVPAPGV
jgi:hypothetical protein